MSNSSLNSISDNPTSFAAAKVDSSYGGRLIDVNSNTAFRSLSPTIPISRGDSGVQEQYPFHKWQAEHLDDLPAGWNTGRQKTRAELLKSSFDPKLLDMPITREQMNHYRIIAENAQSELAALHVKFESVQTELLDLRARVASKEGSLQELKTEVENYKENTARQASLISSLRARVQETEEESSRFSTSKTRADFAMQAVLQENQDLKERIQDLESRLKASLAQWEDSKSKASRYSRSHGHFLSQLSTCLNINIRAQEEPEELLLSKINELYKDNAELKGSIGILEQTVNVHETESKGSRETIMRLVSEVSKEQKKASSLAKQIESLQKNLESTTDDKESLEREIKILKERVSASQRAWEASKQELSQVKKSSTELELSLKSTRGDAKTAHSLHESFIDNVAAALSRDFVAVKPKEEAILEKIWDMCNKAENKKMIISQLEERVFKLSEQLQTQTELHQEAMNRARKTEQYLEDVGGRLKFAEGELVSGDVMRDNLSHEKQKYMKFLEQLSEKMKVERVATDIGFDMRLEAILGRAEQLVKLEANAVIENKTRAHGLQRKLKAQKETLDSRELHMELLRKKIAQLEEEKQVRTALAVERDEANLTVRRLQKKVDRLQKELNVALDSNTELKARLSDTNDLKIKTMEQHKTIDELNKSVNQLEKAKGKTQKMLVSVKSELEFTEREAQEEKERAGNLLEVVTSELKTLKKTLEEVVKREKQLVDFREVVSRMLGLNVNVLALPDYEIIKRLEGLIHNHHHHVVSCA
ncbi:coiled-coil domain-containing protein 170 [Xenopus laevis]|uniref:Coiled-coil domain-containing protein 170 n=2 Tax=Xenopus laevis TaxID=8355 RepID=A0A1L8G7H6_XENLA|nr:coiled-coil domain-containing protein 170 [Xenopus laevis]OCT79929.1 hypothetical protein XELAEV_18026743mg [Xenopus laevis]